MIEDGPVGDKERRNSHAERAMYGGTGLYLLRLCQLQPQGCEVGRVDPARDRALQAAGGHPQGGAEAAAEADRPGVPGRHRPGGGRAGGRPPRGAGELAVPDRRVFAELREAQRGGQALRG